MTELHTILEAALFTAGEPLSMARLQHLFPDNERPSTAEIKEALAILISNYQERGIELVELASGYAIQTRSVLSPWLCRLWPERPQKYSRALLETLALIAYRQPITRADIEEVRGVGVSAHIIKTLLEREWIHVVGQREVPGRPSLYATTRQFLDYFGLKSLSQLPPLKMYLSTATNIEQLSEPTEAKETTATDV